MVIVEDLTLIINNEDIMPEVDRLKHSWQTRRVFSKSPKTHEFFAPASLFDFYSPSLPAKSLVHAKDLPCCVISGVHGKKDHFITKEHQKLDLHSKKPLPNKKNIISNVLPSRREDLNGFFCRFLRQI